MDHQKNPLLTTINELPPGVRYALFGAGQFTARAFDEMDEDDFFRDDRFLMGVIDDAEGPYAFRGYPRLTLPEAAREWRLDYLVLSTDTHQVAMLARLRAGWLRGEMPTAWQTAVVPQRDFPDWVRSGEAEDKLRSSGEFGEAVRAGFGDLTGRRVLILGPAACYPLGLLLAAYGADVTVADSGHVEIDPRWLTDRQRHWVRLVEQHRGRAVDPGRLKAASYGARTLPFGDATFEVVIVKSPRLVALDPEKTAAEIARVVRPAGSAVLVTPAVASDRSFASFAAAGARRQLTVSAVGQGS